MPPRPSPRPLPAAALALALLATGCANTKVSRVWSDAELKESQYQRVMVLVAAATEGRRETAEDRIVAALKREGVDAVRSWDVVGQADLSSRERLAEAVTASHADALLLVRITGKGKETEIHEGREQWVPTGTGVDYYGYVTTAYGLYRKPDISELRTLTAETTLWDVPSRRMVWACQSDSQSASETITTAEVADDYAKVVAKKVTPYLRRK